MSYLLYYIFCVFLLLLHVFQAVECDCGEDDDALEYELKVSVDAEDRQGVGEGGEDENADYHA